MAQRSLPQAGTGVGDSGPYTSDQWAEFFQTVFTGDQEATQGPVRHVLNELEVTEAALAVTTATGVGFVYGHWIINDVALVINIALAAGGLERYDRVVMIQNNTAAAYNTNLALPAAYAAGVPRNSARIAILQGAEAGAAVLPPLLTGPNYYMVELARYFVNDAAVGTVTDYRDYCGLGASGPSTQYLFVPVEGGYNTSTGQSMALTSNTLDYTHIRMFEDQYSSAFGRFTIPGNYASAMIIRGVIVTSQTTRNVYARSHARGGPCNGLTDLIEATTGFAVEAVTVSIHNCLRSLDLSAETLEQGYIMWLYFSRNATNVLDTDGNNSFIGWLVSYTTLT